jgi:hypothetical protein
MRFQNVVYTVMDDVINLLFLVYHCLGIEIALRVEVVVACLVHFVECLLKAAGIVGL